MATAALRGLARKCRSKVDIGEDVPVIMGHYLGYRVVGEDFLAPNDAGNLNHLCHLTVKLVLEGGSFGAARLVS